MVVIVIKYKKISVDVSWHILLLACVSQFDTMHPSMSLGAIFNDRNFSDTLNLLRVEEVIPI